MKNVYGDISPIVLEIEEYRRYGLVAIFVDRDDFRRDIADIRKKLGVTTIPYAFPKYSYKIANDYISLYKHKEFSLDYTITVLEEFCNKEGLKGLSVLDKTLAAAVTSAKTLTSKYQKNSLYFPVVLASILIGTVHEEDFSPTQILTQTDIKQLLNEAQSDIPFVAIRVTRESTPEDVEKDFSFIMRDFFGGREVVDSDGTPRYNYNARYRTPDFSTNIKRDREWYWKNKEDDTGYKMGYKKIWATSSPKERTGDWTGIKHAIKQYQSRLRVET